MANNDAYDAYDALRYAMGVPLDRPPTFLVMFETADGCIKFMERSDPDREIRVAIVRPLPVRFGELVVDPTSIAASVRHRVYELWDRSGPDGRILHYKERVE